jgi:spore coat protein A, manganese oxidase
MVTRRAVLKGGAAATLGVLLPWQISFPRASARSLASPHLTKFLDALPIPPVAPQAANAPYAGVDYYEIAMKPGTWQFHSQLQPAPTWGYWAGGTGIGYLGPTIEARTNSPVVVKYTNLLPTTHLFHGAIDMTLWENLPGVPPDPPGGRDSYEFPAGAEVRCCPHLHGGFTPPQFDGHPESWFTPDGLYHGSHYASLPGAAANETIAWYSNAQRAGMLWFHDHGMAITRLNVYAGLAAVYFIRDDVEAGLNLPTGSYEIPLVIQDKTFNADGSLFYPATGLTAYHPIWVPEFFGDTPVVNGKAYPYLNVEPRRYRLRLLNGSNARFYNLWLEDGKNKQYPLYAIGTEGGFLPAPVLFDGGKTKLLVAPAERFDLIVDFTGLGGKTLNLMNNAKAPYPGGRGGQVNQIMQFRVGTSVTGSDTSTPPANLVLPAIPRLTDEYPSAPLRQVVAKEDEDPATGDPMHVRLNQRWFFEAVEDSPQVGTAEVWEFVNLTPDAHPMHLHLVQFQVVNRQPFDVQGYASIYLSWVANGRVGAPPDVSPYLTRDPILPPPEEMGWKDTVKSYPGQVLRIIAKFDVPNNTPTPAIPGTATLLPAEYVYHCHILEHEDNEMMRPYQVTG